MGVVEDASFRCFQMDQAVRMMREPSTLRLPVGKKTQIVAHNVWKSVSSFGSSAVDLAQARISCHTCLEKEQPASKCCIVSSSWARYDLNGDDILKTRREA